jgi:hypothetical protein
MFDKPSTDVDVSANVRSFERRRKITIVEIFHKCQLPRAPLGNTKSGISSEILICETNQAHLPTFQQSSDRLSEEKKITIVEIFHKCQPPRAPLGTDVAIKTP